MGGVPAGAVLLMLGVVVGLVVAPSARSALSERQHREAEWQRRVQSLSSTRRPWWFVGRHARLALDLGAVLVIVGGTVTFVAAGTAALVGAASAVLGVSLVVITELSRHSTDKQSGNSQP